jgi:UDP-N-acetylmuramoyl-tripeptide--D-alanyl-D-alanine ligase
VREHERIGERVAKVADLLYTVGIRSKGLAQAAVAAGMHEAVVHSFDTAHEAALALVPLVKEGDVVLVKGSQAMRVERVVEVLLANPADRANLARQERAWLMR